MGCSQVPAALPVALPTASPLTLSTSGREKVPITWEPVALVAGQPCTNRFVTHTLDHTTAVHGPAVHQFESNGSGVAINDLNGDGWLDVVLANLNGPVTILWNQGGLVFAKETLADDNTRAVNVVDVDGDGRLDIVLTHIATAPSYWRNTEGQGGTAVFQHEPLPHVLKAAHSMAWDDLNGDGALDLVTGSYDAELGIQPGSTFLFSDGAGVYYYERQGDTFIPTRLAQKSQALVIALFDVNGDAQRDILVGNDFDHPDQVWLRQGDSWQPATPFSTTTQHTMSFDWGDIDNDGRFELYATDMKPYDSSPETMAAWGPMMAAMKPHLPAGDPQIPENVLQVLGEDGRYQNQASQRGVSSTGWSWSGKFGDLDNDGFLDLYVVNGMIDIDLLGYLPNGELVEENQAFRNQGDGRFAPAPEWGLASTASGRGLSLADLDHDGDLDMVVNNLLSPAQLFENQLCGGTGLEVDVRWPGTLNTHALGAQVILHTTAGTMLRDVRASSGYLSGDPARLHFGLPAGVTPVKLEIIWPDGVVSGLDTVSANNRLIITRGISP
jgi:hypothetical protein